MEITRLVAMANRIGDFFDVLPNAQDGMDGVANHIRKSWEVRMRTQLAAWLDAHPAGETGLSPFVESALRTNPERWRVTSSPAGVSRQP